MNDEEDPLYAPSDAFMRAMNGEREAARGFFAAIARGDPLDAETLFWLRGIAAAVLEADDSVDRKRRPARIVEALGLSGRRNRDEQKQELIREETRADGFTDEIGTHRTQHTRIAETATKRGLFHKDKEPKDAADKIRRVRRKL